MRTVAMAVLLALGGCLGTSDTSNGDDDDIDVPDAGDQDAAGQDGGSDAGSDGGGPVGCEAGTRPGPGGESNGESTPSGLNYNVRMPPGYDPTVAVPLVVAYSPAGVTDPRQTEQFKQLTSEAAERGYAIAYVNHFSPMDEGRMAEAANIPADMAARWCIDEGRVYLTGHSDGGSTATIVSLMQVPPTPAAIAPSGQGTDGRYLGAQPCPAEPFAVMVLHGALDALFPGHGAEAAEYWAGCNACGGQGAALPDGCVPWEGCVDGKEVQYCEWNGQHPEWPPLNESMFDFFDRFARE